MKNILNKLMEKKRKKTRDKILEAKRLFDDAVQQAIQDNGTLSKAASDAKSYADAEYNRLLQEANQSVLMFDRFINRSLEIAQHRAYVIPTSEVYIESQSLLDKMKEWGVPNESLSSLEGLISDKTVQNNKEIQARHNLYRIIDTYDYWDRYINWYYNTLNRVNFILFLLMAAILIRAYNTEELF